MGYEWENNRISQQAMFDDQRVWDFMATLTTSPPKNVTLMVFMDFIHFYGIPSGKHNRQQFAIEHEHL